MASPLSRTVQDRVIEAVASHIERHYAFADAARHAAGTLCDDRPRYAGGDSTALAAELTVLLRRHDGHVTLRWQANPAEVLAWEEPDAAANRRRNYRSAGAANPGERFAVGDGFSVFIPTQAPIDPRTGGNWEGTGVIPDRKRPATLCG